MVAQPGWANRNYGPGGNGYSPPLGGDSWAISPVAASGAATTPSSASPGMSSPSPDPSSDGITYAGVSSSPIAGDPRYIAFEDGGAIPDGDSDGGDQPQQTTDLNSVLGVIMDTLDYGRQKNGLLGQAQGDRDNDADDNGGPPDNDADDAIPTAQFEDGGDVPDQAVPDTQGAAPSLAGYVAGADAISPDVAQAMEQNVDPQGQMDPTQRKMLAIANGKDDATRWGLMQHYRQKFNAYKAFSAAAATGNGRKPADLNASAQAATQAYENLPDGNSVSFAPARNGAMVAIVKRLAAKSGSQSQQNFDDGGSVSDDPVADLQQNAEADTPAFNAQAAGASNPNDAQQSQDDGDALPAGSTPDAGQAPDTSSAPPSTPSGTSSGQTTTDAYVMAPSQYRNFIQGQNGQYDHVLQNDVGTALQKSGAQKSHIDPDILAEANELFPMSSQTRQRTQYIIDRESAAAANQNKLDVANATWGARSNIAAANNKSRENIASGREEGYNRRTDVNAATANNRINAQQQQATNRENAITSRSRAGDVRSMVNAQVQQGQPLQAALLAVAQQLRMSPRDVADMWKQPAQQQPTQPVQPSQPSSPAPQTPTPGQDDIKYLLAHPEIASKFDARFGQGAARRAMGQQ